MRDTDAFSLGVDIARALDAAGLPNALGGAIALAAWGVPRATADVDINAFVDDDDLDRVFEVLEALGIEVERDVARADHVAKGMFVVCSPSGTPRAAATSRAPRRLVPLLAAPPSEALGEEERAPSALRQQAASTPWRARGADAA